MSSKCPGEAILTCGWQPARTSNQAAPLQQRCSVNVESKHGLPRMIEAPFPYYERMMLIFTTNIAQNAGWVRKGDGMFLSQQYRPRCFTCDNM